jgi:hypothetical protein
MINFFILYNLVNGKVKFLVHSNETFMCFSDFSPEPENLLKGAG